MRACLLVLGVLWLGCSVQLEGAPCVDDLQCPKEQRCGPQAECVAGPRTVEMLGESCRAAVRVLAQEVSLCFGGSSDDFLKLLGPEAVCPSIEASVAAGRLAFRPEEFGTCLRNLREIPCGDLGLEKLTLGTLLEGCTAFSAQVAGGGACANSADCQGGWCKVEGACPGACQSFIPFSGTCTAQDRCQPGSTCVGSVCRRYAGLGGVCSSVPCDPSSNTWCQEGRCVERKTSGPCVDNAECAFAHLCVRTQPAMGDSSPRECRPAKGVGEPCEPGAAECALLSYCNAGTRTCRSWPGPGERCGDPTASGDGALCLESRCELFGFPAVCLPYQSVGQGCLTSLDCGPAAGCQQFKCVNLWCQGV